MNYGRTDLLFKEALARYLDLLRGHATRQPMDLLRRALEHVGAIHQRPVDRRGPLREADYQRTLHAVLRGQGFSLEEEGRPSERQRVDLVVRRDGFHAYLELKLPHNGTREEHLRQLRAYLQGRPDTAGVLVYFCQERVAVDAPYLTEEYDAGSRAVTILTAHVHRAPASEKG